QSIALAESIPADLLGNLVADYDPSVREPASRFLACIKAGVEAARLSLLHGMQHADPAVRADAAAALGILCQPREWLFHRSRVPGDAVWFWERDWRGSDELYHAVVPALRKALEDRDADVRQRAADALAGTGLSKGATLAEVVLSLATTLRENEYPARRGNA